MLPRSSLPVSPLPPNRPARLLISTTPGRSPYRVRHAAGLALAGIALPAGYPRPSADLDHARAFAVALGLEQDVEDCIFELAGEEGQSGLARHVGSHIAHAFRTRGYSTTEFG